MHPHHLERCAENLPIGRQVYEQVCRLCGLENENNEEL